MTGHQGGDAPRPKPVLEEGRPGVECPGRGSLPEPPPYRPRPEWVGYAERPQDPPWDGVDDNFDDGDWCWRCGDPDCWGVCDG
jgi:hypothetical protein